MLQLCSCFPVTPPPAPLIDQQIIVYSARSSTSGDVEEPTPSLLLQHHLIRRTGRQTGEAPPADRQVERQKGGAPPVAVMSVSPGLADLSRLYQTEFVRSARAVGVLWAVCTLCFAIIQVVILVQPSWICTTDIRPQQVGPDPPSGTLGLFEVCMESDWPVPDCRGGLSSLSPLPSFQSVAVLVGVSLWAVWTSVLCLCLFRFCGAATVYKICAWLQLTAGFCLALACLLFPDSWESPEMKALCGDSVGSFSPGNCSIHWAYILAILGVVDYAILATLAFVLANRQDALLPPDTQEVTTGLLMTA